MRIPLPQAARPRATAGTVLAAATAVTGCVPVPAQAGSAEPLPFPAQVSTVIERGAIEGHPVRVLQFHTRLAVAKVLADTRHAWSMPHGVGTVDASSGSWRIVSRQDDGGFRTLQVRPRSEGGSEGLLTLWRREEALPRAGIDLAALLPADAQVRRRFSAVDAGRRNETIVAVDAGTPSMVAERIGVRAAASGLRVAPIVRAGAGEDGTAVARLYVGHGAELAMTVHRREGGSAVVMHLSEVQR